MMRFACHRAYKYLNRCNKPNPRMRPLIYGNGTLLVCADERGIIRDFYYPYAGMENHGGYMRLGLFDAGTGEFGWLEDWEIMQRYKNRFSWDYFHLKRAARPPAPRSSARPRTTGPNAAVTVWDMVHQDRNVFMRTIRVKNTSDGAKEFSSSPRRTTISWRITMRTRRSGTGRCSATISEIVSFSLLRPGVRPVHDRHIGVAGHGGHMEGCGGWHSRG